MPKAQKSLLALLSVLLLAGCRGESRTFAGFTFGGGGNTFSCEPALWLPAQAGFYLKAGAPGEPTYLELQGTGPLKLGEPAPLSVATVAVPDHQGTASLVSGNLVSQSTEGGLAHGSFDLKVKGADGREFQVVGSYTASIETPPNSTTGASPAP